MTILSDIAAYKRDEIAAATAHLPLGALEKLALAVDAPRNFRGALEKARAESRYGLIAEIKKASPSRGLIRADFDPSQLARAYERGGASLLELLAAERNDNDIRLATAQAAADAANALSALRAALNLSENNSPPAR